MACLNLGRKTPSLPVLEEIQEGLECVICMTIPKQDPVYQCDNGHIICRSCQYKATGCPRCGVKIGNTRCIAAENILAKCPKSCANNKYGCTIRLGKLSLEKHEEVCRYKPVHCPATTCNDLIAVEDVTKHMDGVHDVYQVSSKSTGAFWHSFEATYQKVTKQIKNQTSTEFTPGRCSIDGRTFFLMCWRSYGSQGNWHAWVYILGSSEEKKKEEKKYKFKVAIDNDELDEKISYTGQTASLQIPRGQICSLGRCLKFDDGLAVRFSKNDELKFSFKIRRMSIF